jgi:hypothetical protein
MGGRFRPVSMSTSVSMFSVYVLSISVLSISVFCYRATSTPALMTFSLVISAVVWLAFISMTGSKVRLTAAVAVFVAISTLHR